jgi:hypothetical protein
MFGWRITNDLPSSAACVRPHPTDDVIFALGGNVIFPAQGPGPNSGSQQRPPSHLHRA